MRKSPSNEELARSMISPSQTPSLELAQRTLAAPPTPLTPLTPSLQLAQDAVATTASPPIPTASAHFVGNENSSNSNASLTSQRSLSANSEEEVAELVAAVVESAGLLDTALASSTNTIKKGKNFVPDEDLKLAAAWLEISGDPVVGNEQKLKVFWEKVHDSFVDRLTSSGYDMSKHQRGVNSLRTRWRTLQATCNKFADCYAAVLTRNESGKTVEDKTVDAHAIYREQNGTQFKSQGVWTLLRNSPKWMESITAKKTRKRPSSSSNDHTDEHDTQTAHDANQERPIGRKAAKKTLEMEKSFIVLVAKLTKETEAKNRLLKEATSDQIMARNMEGMTPV
ncbi:hypothetical protein F441_18751 [Phytophthora nicotianae CJ01A1]|uniref:No apical meristem-associated C-terminal domain-containing protein n=5 Tax=Phytophthora nicotianae TaxID=4792 RepID=V9E689_PHYNI|nr:hypothetical protein F443_18939 [Phytophthora nicotianae P1569]ETK74936.1 hypothetical protein L915_18369 [Phytophthora nicotianae]ETP04488.1 hypothetical protein F441_18751 [Phytophthora nicotianae CJ01A1]